MAAFIIPAMPAALGGLPPGPHGICYDIFTHATEDPPPAGWGAFRANTYYQLIRELQISGFNRLQKSDYMNPAASMLTTWNTMLGLLNIQPPGKLESTVSGLHLYRLDPNQVMDVTPFVKLGGMYCQGLRGPTPRDLTFVPPAVGPLVPVPVVPAAMALPVHTQATPAAGILANWLG